ncbi:retrovirus-related Pol polyprotein from transposon 412 [Trichonephila clavipes]|uniref:RNA-directed DNA polymerase n=1 Tax=Trichonephila clavipes TaxID=2585209 RepID=A0A8X7BMC1_TRICX|nr:retrovirus-related Pol polyprotein from transposon 412 [Trichonephila clavipes]
MPIWLGMNANMNTKLTNVNEQISTNMDELNNKLTANKEELKSDLKGIGDKLTTMDKKFEEMEGRIESVENKFEDMESKLEAKIFEKVEEVSISFRSDLEKLKQKVMTGQGDEFKFQAPYSKPSIKLSTYDGKSSWQVYKTQFSIVADANQWDSHTKACQLAASLRADAADILQTLPETQRLDFDALVNALELRFGEKCVKDYSRLQLKAVKGFSNIARPLHKLTESKQKFQWTKECEDSFLQLKEALTSSPILIYPQPDKPFILDTDASNESVGAVLSQEIDGQERVVAYWSKCLSKPERNYCVTRKELLAIVKAIEHFHHYLYGQKFLLRTDHASLTWLMNFRNTEGQVARWIQRLNEYYFDIRHRKGSSHGNADALSRRPCPENCRHCSRVETKYDYAIRQITTSTATPPDPWSDEKVREDQMADPDIKPLIEFMESSSNKPSWQDISAYSPTTKQYWALWSSLHLRNGVLYRKFESEDGKTFRWQLVLPRSRIPEVLKELHGSPTGGHFGVMKTLHRVRERFFWGKVRADVEQWCKSCDACSARKGPKIRSRGKLHRYNVGAPFERIAFDILGPLPRTASGNKYLLVVMDYFTKWPEVYPIPDQEAPTVAEAVVQHWISRYGVPLQLHSDQGRNFVSAVLKGVCELLGIDKTKTTPLHPQSDGMVERFNRTTLNNLSLMVSKNQQDWDQKVPLFLLAYRSAVHETTGYSPSQMLFGRDLRLPCDLLFGRPPDTPSSPEEYVQNLQARFEDVHNLARERINLRTEKMKTRYDTKATGHQFKEGDKVWFYNPTRRKGLSPKLQSHWDGPYTILKIINDVVIRIRKSTNSKPRVVHYDRLAPYYGHNS